MPLKGSGGRENYAIRGNNIFGPGGRSLTDAEHLIKPIGPGNPVMAKVDDKLVYATDVVEGFSFTPVSEPLYKTTYKKGRRRITGRRRLEPQQHVIGEAPVMVVNPETGQQEQGVRFDYAFNPNLVGGERAKQLGIPPYKECEGNGRDDNSLVVSTVLPKSVADALQPLIEENERARLAGDTSRPSTLRNLVKQIVTTSGGVSPEAWEGTMQPDHHGWKPRQMKPPYDDLPSGHRINKLTPYTDDFGRETYLAQPL